MCSPRLWGWAGEKPWQTTYEECSPLFEEKCGARVRVVSLSDFSKELCGGSQPEKLDLALERALKIVAKM